MILFILYFALITTGYAVDRSVMYLYYYNQSSITNHIYKTNLNENICSWFNTTKQTAIFIHGWSNVTNVDTYNGTVRIRDPMLIYDINFLALDFPYDSLYTTAVANQPTVGQLLGQYLNELSTNCSYPLSLVVIVGHSLGAHIGGVAGRTTGSTISVIFGLDPAGPEFLPTSTNRLYSTDAGYVQVMHTNAGVYGIAFSIGTSDFYVNGGTLQPSCNNVTNVVNENDVTSFCSHHMAYAYYGVSVANTTAYQGSTCIVSGITCLNPSYAYMGGFAPDKTAIGNYYVTAAAAET